MSSENLRDFSNSVFVIDASAFVFRAYYALAPLSSKGRPSHAVAGFASMLLKILRDKRPLGCVVVFDSKSPSFRKEIYSEYKANREVPPPDLSGQITAVHEMCEKAGLLCLQKEGIEADDLIATFTKKQAQQKHDVVIVSSDKDLAQLVGPRVTLYDSFRERLLGPEEVKEKFGVYPEQIHDYLSLTGDSSDNIPGIKGVGPKTALQILEKYPSVGSLLKDQSKLPEKLAAKVKESVEALKLSHQLVALKENVEGVPTDSPPLRFPFPSTLKDFLFEWDCSRLLTQFPDLLDSEGANTVATESSLSTRSSCQLRMAESEKDLAEIAAQIRRARRCVIDFETDSFHRQTSRAVGFSLAWNAEEAWYIPWRHPGSSLPESLVRGFIENLLKDDSISWIAHNLKFDEEVLRREELPEIEARASDTMIEAYLLNSDRRSFSLDNLSQELLGEKKGDLKSLLGKSQNFSDIPLEAARDYAAQDAHLTWLLHEKLRPQLAADAAIQWLYDHIEIPLVRVLASMERTGILVDKERLSTLSQELHVKLDQTEKEIYQLAGEEFNIQSPKQLQTILFEKLKLTPKRKTKTGYSTDESVLQDLANEHPLPEILLEFRGLAKLLSTYVDVLPDLVAADGRLHTQYHQTGTATGRLSSSEPNLQNIPVRTEAGMKIRSAFVPAEGYLLMSADYSQVELRLFAAMSGDENMIRAFQRGRDIHAETAKIIFGSDEKEFRSRAKAINFGIIYGISAFGLSQQLKIPRSQAQDFIESYFAKFPKLKEFMEELVKRARKDQATFTLFGRRRPLPDIQSKNPALRQFAERVAVNAPVQGTAADIMKSAMVRVFERLKTEKLASRILLQVHDELVLEVKASEKAQVQELVVSEMQSLSKTPIKELPVPLAVDAGFGSSWAEI